MLGKRRGRNYNTISRFGMGSDLLFSGLLLHRHWRKETSERRPFYPSLASSHDNDDQMRRRAKVEEDEAEEIKSKSNAATTVCWA